MKIIKINKIVLLISSFMGFLYANSDHKIPNRQMIMFFENFNIENIYHNLDTPYAIAHNNNKNNNKEINLKEYMQQSNPTGIKSTTGGCMVAMHNEIAPILASKTIIINILEHKQMFNDFLNLNINQLHKKYSGTSKFKDKQFIEKFKNICIYAFTKYNQVNKDIELFINKYNITDQNINNLKSKIQEEILKIVNDIRFSMPNAPELLNNTSDTPEAVINAAYLEMYLNLIANSINYDNWIIKEVDDNICLLIPKRYLADLSIKYKDIKFKNHNTKLRNKLTKLEIKLGLKVNHLKDLNFKKLINTKSFNLNSNKHRFNIIAALKKLFVNKKFTPNIIWSFYCTGHGCYESDKKIFIPQLNNLKRYYKNKILKTFSRQQKKQYKKNIELINNEIQKINEIDSTRNYVINNIDISDGIILSMSQEDFKNILLFLNNNINTAFLYYTSCFAGGQHLIKPYMHNNQHLIFNYNIVSGTICENMAIQFMPVMNIPPYYHINNQPNLEQSEIDFKNKKLKLITSTNFETFFNILKTNNYNDHEVLKKIAESIRSYKLDDQANLSSNYNNAQSLKICNTPSIRFKGEIIFQSLPFQYEHISIINSEYKSNKLDKNVNLLYSDYIPQKLYIDNKPEAIISMLPGLSSHVFEHICAPNLELQDVIKPFLYFDEIPAPKVFWIKKLNCKNKDKLINNQENLELNNVLIMRNITNTDKLKYTGKDTYQDFAYIYFDNNKSKNSFYKIKWPKYTPNIDLKKDLILHVSKSNTRRQSYKNEIFALKPDLRTYIQSTKDKLA